MTLSIRFFGSKSWPKCINFSKSHSHTFTLKLPRNRQRSMFLKEILRIVNFSICSFRYFFEVKRGNRKHFASAFAIAASNYWSVCINKALLLKKFVNSISGRRTNSVSGAESICARTKVSNSSKVFE